MPALGKVNEKLPLDCTPEFHIPLALQQLPEVVECEPPAHVHLTVPPALIVVVPLPLTESTNEFEPPPTITDAAPPETGAGVIFGSVGDEPLLQAAAPARSNKRAKRECKLAWIPTWTSRRYGPEIRIPSTESPRFDPPSVRGPASLA